MRWPHLDDSSAGGGDEKGVQLCGYIIGASRHRVLYQRRGRPATFSAALRFPAHAHGIAVRSWYIGWH